MNTDFRLLPEQASTMAPRVDALFWFITGVSVFFTLLIAVAADDLRRPLPAARRRTTSPSRSSARAVLETTWSVIPLALSMVMFFWGANVYFDLVRTPDNALEVYVVGKQWMWHAPAPRRASARSTSCTSRSAGRSSSS